ncbi:MAG: gamma-glutamyl-gamma-aminobutyrate hydrolase family protein [Clostridia bacterium]|nr:gamma-glutamyl-gamma-aminobutyrate hydrolase family protein [Clostridia bacterium]
MKKIGIVPKSLTIKENNSCMQDYYQLGNNYIKRVAEAGVTPVGLCPMDNWISEEQLDMCDAFLVQGGAAFFPYHFQIIHHAITTGKRMLGICLGEQLIYVYLELRRKVEERGYEGDLAKAIWDYKQTQSSVLEAIPNHRYEYPEKDNEDVAKHDVNIVPGTLLHKVIGRDSIRLCSFHYLNVPPTQTLATINAWSALGDGVVEGVEYGDNILGIQGHPEADDLLPEFFEFLVKD